MGRVYSTHGEKMNAYRILMGKPERKRPLGRPRRRWMDNIIIDLKPGIDCARLPREAMFGALPFKVDSMLPRAAERTLPRANVARVEPHRSGSLSRGKGLSVCCALSVEMVLWRSGMSFEAIRY
jgi:hypothetical protein